MPTPAQLAKSGTEHAEQVAFFAWLAMATMRGLEAADDERCYNVKGHAEATYGHANGIRDLEWFHAIPNGGSRGDDEKSRAIRGGQLKAEGQRNGVFDTFLPRPNNGYAGLYVEFKRRGFKTHKNGGMSDKQVEFQVFARNMRYAAEVAYGWEEAVAITKAYIKGEL